MWEFEWDVMVVRANEMSRVWIIQYSMLVVPGVFETGRVGGDNWKSDVFRVAHARRLCLLALSRLFEVDSWYVDWEW